MNEVYFEVPVTTEESRVFIPDENGGLLVFRILFKEMKLEHKRVLTIIGAYDEVETQIKPNDGDAGNKFEFPFDCEGRIVSFEIIVDNSTLDIHVVY